MCPVQTVTYVSGRSKPKKLPQKTANGYRPDVLTERLPSRRWAIQDRPKLQERLRRFSSIWMCRRLRSFWRPNPFLLIY